MNHLGNVLTTVEDWKRGIKSATDSSLIAYYEPVVVSAQEYYPFGMMMRQSQAGKYRFGFNGKENDNEVKGLGNQQDYGMRIYDGRLGRFLSVDPFTDKYPELTPYQFASNRPIDGIDLDGTEWKKYFKKYILPMLSPVPAGVVNKETAQGFSERAQKTWDDLKKTVKDLKEKTGFNPKPFTTTFADPNSQGRIFDLEQKAWKKAEDAVVHQLEDYYSIVSRVVKGDKKAAGELLFEVTLFLVLEEAGTLVKSSSLGKTLNNVFKRTNETYGLETDITVFPSMRRDVPHFSYDRRGKIKNGPEFGDLKDHAARHGNGDAISYYNSAVLNTKNSTWTFRVRHDGQTKIVHVTPLEDGNYIFTSTNQSGNRIYTHMEVNKEYLINKGITLPSSNK